MVKLESIILENNQFVIHPIRGEDRVRSEIIEQDILNLFSDPESIPYNPEKLIHSLDEAKLILGGAAMGYQFHSQYTLFITLKSTQNIIGEIIIVPPFIAEDRGVKDTWLIEYYLRKEIWNKGFMTGMISGVLENLKNQGVKKIGAFVDNKNIGSIKVLEKNGFTNTKNPNLDNKFFELVL